jgi:probable F420-dependent oxidoreductase
MDIGIYGVCTDETLRPDEMARLVEDAGFHTLSLGEHTHFPVDKDSDYPLGEMPRDYFRTHDLFIAMNTALLATTTLRVCSSIMQLVQRDPIITAKEAASIDVLSGGRIDLVVGAGWNVKEIANHGVDPADRYDVLREKMLALRAIWSNDEAEFHGEHVSFDPIFVWPKPVQEGGVPLILGSNSDGAEDRAREYGSGWGPIGGDGIADRVRAFVDSSPLPVTISGVKSDAAQIEAYASAGAHRGILNLGGARDAEEAKRTLDELRSLVDLALA